MRQLQIDIWIEVTDRISNLTWEKYDKDNPARMVVDRDNVWTRDARIVRPAYEKFRFQDDPATALNVHWHYDYRS